VTKGFQDKYSQFIVFFSIQSHIVHKKVQKPRCAEKMMGV